MAIETSTRRHPEISPDVPHDRIDLRATSGSPDDDDDDDDDYGDCFFLRQLPVKADSVESVFSDRWASSGPEPNLSPRRGIRFRRSSRNRRKAPGSRRSKSPASISTPGVVGFLVSFVFASFHRCYGVIALALCDYFSEEDAVFASGVTAMGVAAMTPLFSEFLLRRSGAVPIIVASNILAGAAFCTSAFVPSSSFLLASFAAPFGIAFGLCRDVADFCVDGNIAVSLRSLGGAVGGVVLAPLTGLLFWNYAVGGAMVIVGAATLHLLPTAMIARTVARPDRSKDTSESKPRPLFEAATQFTLDTANGLNEAAAFVAWMLLPFMARPIDHAASWTALMAASAGSAAPALLSVFCGNRRNYLRSPNPSFSLLLLHASTSLLLAGVNILLMSSSSFLSSCFSSFLHGFLHGLPTLTSATNRPDDDERAAEDTFLSKSSSSLASSLGFVVMAISMASITVKQTNIDHLFYLNVCVHAAAAVLYLALFAAIRVRYRE